MKLILIRHGETVETKNCIIQGHLPGTLCNEGIEQAKKVAFRLKDEKIDIIYSSDLKRAASMAGDIASYHKNAKVKFIKELREFDFGNFTGKHKKDVDWNSLPADMETVESVYNRAKKLLEDTYSKYNNKTVVFVSHAGPIKALIAIILNKPVEYMYEITEPFYASISIFEIKEDKKHIVHLIGCKKHLS